MLALFDSNENKLKSLKDLTRARLYHDLMIDFIRRELSKYPDYRNSSTDKQQELVDTKIKEISLAALGMFNRNELYIRQNDFNEDLYFLDLIDKSSCADERYLKKVTK